MKKSKWVVFKFLPYEYKALEKYLESMALRGWKLVSIYGYYIKFKKIEPQTIKYSVDVMDSVSFFDGRNSKNILEYREYCKEAGWEFICEREKIQVYCSAGKVERVPIHTEEGENFKTIFKASLKYMILNLLVAILLVFGQYMMVFKVRDANFLASNLSLITLFIVTILSLSEGIEVVNFSLWLLNNKFLITRGINNKLTKLKAYIYKFGVLSAFVMSIFAVISGEIVVAKIIVMNLLLSYGFYKFKDFIESSSLKKKRSINIIAYVAICIITLVMLNTVLFKDMLNKRTDSSGSYIITLEDFNDKHNEDKTGLYVSNNSSILASRLYYSIDGENMNLNYELFESKYRWIINYKFKCIKDRLNELGIRCVKVKTEFPEEVEVYKNEKGHIYYILSDNKVLEFYNFEHYNNIDDL